MTDDSEQVLSSFVTMMRAVLGHRLADPTEADTSGLVTVRCLDCGAVAQVSVDSGALNWDAQFSQKCTGSPMAG